MGPRFARRDDSLDDSGRRGRGAGLLPMLLAALIASGVTGGSTVAVLKASDSAKEERIHTLEVEMKATREQMAAVVTNVEWLVRAMGGDPKRGP